MSVAGSNPAQPATDLPGRPWPDAWMLPTRANFDEALNLVWARDPDAVFYTDIRTKIPVVESKRHKVRRTTPFMPGFTWGRTPQLTGAALVAALKL